MYDVNFQPLVAATYTQAFGPFTFAFGSECDLPVLAFHEQSFTNT